MGRPKKAKKGSKAGKAGKEVTKAVEPFQWKDPTRLGSDGPLPGKCGAKLRGGKGGYCKRPPMVGEKRCFHHRKVGRTPPEIKGAIQKGGATRPKHKITAKAFYADGLMPDELKAFDLIALGKVDGELKIARLQLRRLLMAQKAYQEAVDNEEFNPDGSVVVKLRMEAPSTVDENTGDVIPGPVLTKKIKRHQDYTHEINKTLENISKIELRRAELAKQEPPDNTNTPLTKLITMLKGVRDGEK